jgi:hypothetical protein
MLVIDSPAEEVEETSWFVDIRGWAIAPGGVASVEVFVNGESRLAQLRLSRTDVAATLSDSSARASGWQSPIGMWDLVRGENHLRVVLSGVDGSTAEAKRTFRWAGMADGYMPPLLGGIPTRDVDSAYQAMLGRKPTDGERLVADERGLLATVSELASSEEHHALFKAKALGLHLLSGSEIARAAYPQGTISKDVVAIVGTDGRMMIDAGSNDFVPQYQGAYRITDEWVDQWKRVVKRGRERAATAGVPLAQIVVPEKLSTEIATYPRPLEIKGPRPIEILLKACPAVIYPLEQFRGSKDPAFPATESHVSPAGARILFETVMEQLGHAPLTSPIEYREYLYLGDLGVRFDPPVFDAGTGPDAAATVEIVDQNIPEMVAVGGHLGTYRIAHNPAAPYAARVLVFGDSYAMLPPPGVPGGFGDLLCRAFETVHYCWAPFCWDQKIVDETKPDAIVQEICERMIQAVPVLDVDLGELAAATLARKAQVGFDELFPTHLEFETPRPTRLVRRR